MVSPSRDVLATWSISVFNIRARILRSFVTEAKASVRETYLSFLSSGSRKRILAPYLYVSVGNIAAAVVVVVVVVGVVVVVVESGTEKCTKFNAPSFCNGLQ